MLGRTNIAYIDLSIWVEIGAQGVRDLLILVGCVGWDFFYLFVCLCTLIGYNLPGPRALLSHTSAFRHIAVPMIDVLLLSSESKCSCWPGERYRNLHYAI